MRKLFKGIRSPDSLMYCNYEKPNYYLHGLNEIKLLNSKSVIFSASTYMIKNLYVFR